MQHQCSAFFKADGRAKPAKMHMEIIMYFYCTTLFNRTCDQ